jgi:hypothetical protein
VGEIELRDLRGFDEAVERVESVDHDAKAVEGEVRRSHDVRQTIRKFSMPARLDVRLP